MILLYYSISSVISHCHFLGITIKNSLSFRRHIYCLPTQFPNEVRTNDEKRRSNELQLQEEMTSEISKNACLAITIHSHRIPVCFFLNLLFDKRRRHSRWRKQARKVPYSLHCRTMLGLREIQLRNVMLQR